MNNHDLQHSSGKGQMNISVLIICFYAENNIRSTEHSLLLQFIWTLQRAIFFGEK